MITKRFGVRTWQKAGGAALVVMAVATGCSSTPAVGPNVVGMTLPSAEEKLTASNIAFSTHAIDGSLGVIVKDNWVVCEQVTVDATTVRLEVAKRGC